jgi:hypothetical protein
VSLLLVKRSETRRKKVKRAVRLTVISSGRQRHLAAIEPTTSYLSSYQPISSVQFVCVSSRIFEREKPVDPKIAYRHNTHTHTLSVYRRRHCPSLLVVCIFKRKVKKRGGMMVKSFSFSKEKEEGNIVECRPVPLLQQTYPQPKRFLGVLLKGRVCVCVG